MRWLLPWALLGLLGLGVAAGAVAGQVQSRPPGPTPTVFVDNVLTATSAAGSAHLRFSTVALSSDPSERSRQVGTGVIDFSSGDFRITQVNTQVDNQSTNGGPVHPVTETWTEGVIAIGATMYRNDLLAESGSFSTPWITSHYPRSTHQAFGLDAGTDAENALSGLAGELPVASVHELGADMVDGAATTRYVVTDALPRLCSDGRRGAALLGPLIHPTAIWVDGDGRLVRAQVTTHLSGQFLSGLGQAVGGSTTPPAPETIVTTLTFSDFGAPVRIAAPPASPGSSSFSVGSVGGSQSKAVAGGCGAPS